MLLTVCAFLMLTIMFAHINNHNAYNLDIYEDSRVYQLLKAVVDEDKDAICREVSSDRNLLNYYDSICRCTPLNFAISHDCFKSAEELIRLGADVDGEDYDGYTPLFSALIGNVNNRIPDVKYLNLLINSGVNVNKCFISTSHNKNYELEDEDSPLIQAVKNDDLNVVKLLLNSGCDVNYKGKMSRKSAAITALEQYNFTIAHLLIVVYHADICEPYFCYKPDLGVVDTTKSYKPVELLFNLIPQTGTKEYNLKQEIVNELYSQGIDYYNEKCSYFESAIEGRSPRFHNSTNILNQIKKVYGSAWREYFDKY